MSEEVALKSVSDVAASIRSIGNQIDILTSKGNLMECNGKLSTIESAKLDVSTAYTLATLYFMYLKLHGVPTTTENHPIHTELNRIKTYVEKVNKAASTITKPVHKPASIDTQAAKRMINFELNDNNNNKEESSGDITNKSSKKLKVNSV